MKLKYVGIAAAMVCLSTTIATAQVAACLTVEEERGGTPGRANFTGDAWDGSAYGVGLVPGTGIEFIFDDGTTYLYEDEDNVIADNLYSLQNIWAEGLQPPYPAVRRTDGSIKIITDPIDCSGWMVVHPTITPAGWEDHPLTLAGCLSGAYRATDDIIPFGGNTFIASFRGEGVVLHSTYPLWGENAIIVERYDGYRAVTGGGTSCGYLTLTIGGAP